MLTPRGRNPRTRALAIMAGVCVLAMLVGGLVMRWIDQGSPAAGAEAPGPATVSTCRHTTQAARELRGMWLTTVYNIDWPSRKGLDEKTVKAEYLGWLELAGRLHFNAIFVHIRPSGDAFWPSTYAPWSDWLTGKRDGVSPGWDPLEFMVAEAHARNIEFHGWFNPYRGGQPAPSGAGGDLRQLAPNHPLRAHPDWAIVYPTATTGSRLYFDPGIPEARRFVEDSILDAVSRYDLDGVHFDDFFYPYPEAGQTFNDAKSYAAHGAGFASRGEWRRHNVNTFVEEISQRIKAVKPWVKFGISPFGIWRNSRTDPAGSDTRGLQSYDEIYADTRLWVTKGWLDYIVPQLYWHIGFGVADYAKLLPWWSKVVAGTKAQLYIGQADYRIGEDGAWSDPSQLDRQLALNKRYQVSGSIHYNANSVRADRLGAVSRYTAAHYAAPALIPTMTSLGGTAPPPPSLVTAGRDAGGATTLTWHPGASSPSTSFAVYRVDGAAAGGAPGTAHLIATVRRAGAGPQTWTDRSAGAGQPDAYCVTALDRLFNESPASAAGY